MPLPLPLPASWFWRAAALAFFFTASVSAQELLFDSPESARAVLSARDAFVERLSPFDRSARLKTNGPVSEAQFLDFVARSALDWTSDERQRIESAFKRLRPSLQRLARGLPQTIRLIKTSGREEGGAPYTRANAIILPSQILSRPSNALDGILAHESFHLLSRANPKLRDQLYATIGFIPCGEIQHPQSLKDRRITNPDAPVNAHAISLEVQGKPALGVPILYASSPAYNLAKGGEFFAYLTLKFLLIETAPDGSSRAIADASGPRLIAPDEASGFYEKIGRNTGYIIHPEEVLADHFSMLVRETPAPKSPEPLELLKSALTSAK